jgi:diacylglycerol kinase (ATP)
MKDRSRKFSLADRLRSFRYAFNGIKSLITDEHNFRIHLLALLLIITTGILVGITKSDWLAIIFVSALVLISESFNSSIERLSDAVNPGIDDRIRKAKDIAAAAVLISAMAAIITGLLVFVPYLLKFLN